LDWADLRLVVFAGMDHIFGLKEADLCALFGYMLQDFCSIFGHLLQDLSLYAPYLAECARCASNKGMPYDFLLGMPYDNCPFFLDGTFR
jgi:hypothetical protein